MIAAYQAVVNLPAQLRAGISEMRGLMLALLTKVNDMSKGLDALKATDAALASEVQGVITALKADSDKIAQLLAAQQTDPNADNDDEVLAAAASLQAKVDQLHAAFTPAADPAPATGA